MSARPGAFVDPTVPLAFVKPSAAVDARVEKKIRTAYIVSRKRTETQDLLFLVNQLVEVAGKALSPGINDPITAMSCMDWLASGLIQFAGRHVASAARHDEEGALRVLARPVDFTELAEAVFGQLRPYFETDRNAAIHMMDSIGRIARHLCSADQARLLLGHAEALNEGCGAELSHRADHEAVAARLAFVRHRLEPLLGAAYPA